MNLACGSVRSETAAPSQRSAACARDRAAPRPARRAAGKMSGQRWMRCSNTQRCCDESWSPESSSVRSLECQQARADRDGAAQEVEEIAIGLLRKAPAPLSVLANEECSDQQVADQVGEQRPLPLRHGEGWVMFAASSRPSGESSAASSRLVAAIVTSRIVHASVRRTRIHEHRSSMGSSGACSR